MKRLSNTKRHHHCFEIIVSQGELLTQLEYASTQTNLLKVLTFGKSLPDYECLLQKVCIKFEVLSSLVYPETKTANTKPPLKVYIKKLFEGSYETRAEVREHVERLTKSSVTEEFAATIFQKLLFVMCYCCLAMADPHETWWENTYHSIIEYAVVQNDFGFSDYDNIWDAYSAELCKEGKIKDYHMGDLPEEMLTQLIESYEHHEPFRW